MPGAVPYPEASMSNWPTRWARSSLKGQQDLMKSTGTLMKNGAQLKLLDVGDALSEVAGHTHGQFGGAMQLPPPPPGIPGIGAGLPQLARLRSVSEADGEVPPAPAWEPALLSPSKDRLRSAVINMSVAANLLAAAKAPGNGLSGFSNPPMGKVVTNRTGNG